MVSLVDAFEWHSYTPGHYETPPPPDPTAPQTGSAECGIMATNRTDVFSINHVGNVAHTDSPLNYVGPSNLGGYPTGYYYKNGAYAGGIDMRPGTAGTWTFPKPTAAGAVDVYEIYLHAWVSTPPPTDLTLPDARLYVPAVGEALDPATVDATGLSDAAPSDLGGETYAGALNIGSNTLSASLVVTFAEDVTLSSVTVGMEGPAGSVNTTYTVKDAAGSVLFTKTPTTAWGGYSSDGSSTIWTFDTPLDFVAGQAYTFAWSYTSGEPWLYHAESPRVLDGAVSSLDYYFGAALQPGYTTRFRVTGVQTATTADPVPVWVPGAWGIDPDRSAALVSWSVAYGREDVTDRGKPIQATVALHAPLAGPCPEGSERVRLTLSDAAATALGLTADEVPRFTGEITDAEVDPARKTYTITAVGRLGRARRREVDGRGWPVELDGPRVLRILDAAIRTGDPLAGTIDGGTFDLVAATSSRQAVGALLDLVADSAGGVVVEQPTGAVDYHDAEHRDGAPVVLTLTAAEILNQIRWSQHVGDIINEVQVTYGTAGDKVAARDPDSVRAVEVYPTSLTTALTSKSDAYDRGTIMVARRSTPRWQLPNLVVDLRRTVSDAQVAKLLALRHGDRIKVADIPPGGPLSGAVELYVEGITETATKRSWLLSLAVSDPVLSGGGIRWRDVDPALTWDAVDPTLTWLDVALLSDPAAL